MTCSRMRAGAVLGLEHVRLQQGSIETLPFEDASFDAVSCTQTLLYVEDMDKALREIYRVLKPRGRIAIIETDWSGAIINSLDQAMTDKIFNAWDLAVAQSEFAASAWAHSPANRFWRATRRGDSGIERQLFGAQLFSQYVAELCRRRC